MASEHKQRGTICLEGSENVMEALALIKEQRKQLLLEKRMSKQENYLSTQSKSNLDPKEESD